MALARLEKVSAADLMPQVISFVEKAKELPGVLKIFLFGSMARDEMTAASDIDLAIIVDLQADLRDLKTQLRLLKISHLTWPTDLFVCDESWYKSRKKFGGVCVSIALEGRLLFERSKEGY